MADSQLPRFAVLNDIHGLLGTVLQKACKLQSTGKFSANTTSPYMKQLFDLMDAITNIRLRSSIVAKLRPETFAVVVQKSNEAGLIARIDDVLASSMDALKSQEKMLSIAASTLSIGHEHDSEPEIAQLLRAEAPRLTQLQKDLKLPFEGLFSRCNELLLRGIQRRLNRSSGIVDDFTDISNLVCLAFHKSPFHLVPQQSGHRRLAPILASLNFRGWKDVDYPSLMKSTAECWVDDYVQKPRDHLIPFNERYLRLLDGFDHFLEATQKDALPPDSLLSDLGSPPAITGYPSWAVDPLLSCDSRSIIQKFDCPDPLPTYIEATEERETRQRDEVLRDIRNIIGKEIDRERTRVFSVALCGMVKSGKSLFLNAVLGHSILPSDELPSTAWPCRVRHVKGQLEPHLSLCEPGKKPIFQDGIVALRLRLKAILERNNCTEDKLTEDKFIWEHNLAPSTRENWETFRHPSFTLSNEARGEENVYKLLAQMNDIVRLCRSFGIQLVPERGSWPLITVEFLSLRDEPLDGTFEFYDLPGVGEFTEHFLGLQELINLVAQEVNVIVPVVSLKEVSKNDWRTELPQSILTASGMREPPLIICTHRDQVEERHVKTQVDRVLAAFCRPTHRAGDGNRVKTMCISSSSRLGFGAQILTKLSLESKPDYKTITDEGVPEAVRDCVKHILGDSSLSRMMYNHLTNSQWLELLHEKLQESGLTEAMGMFTKKMAKEAHSQALLRGVVSISQQLNKLHSTQLEDLLRMRRTKEECEAAKQNFQAAERMIRNAQRTWRAEEDGLRNDAIKAIRRELSVLEKECLNAAHQLFGRAESILAARYQNLTGKCQLYEHHAGQLKFTDETISAEFLEEALKITRVYLETRKYAVATKLRRAIVDKEINEQMKVLTSSISLCLGNDQATLMSRLDHEMNGVEASMRGIPIFSFVQKASRRETETDSVSWFERIFLGRRAKSTSFMVISREEVTRLLQEELIRPYIRAFRESAECSFKRMMALGCEVVENAVTTLLDEERARYELELSKKGTEPAQDIVASSVSAHMNVIAAEAALQRLETMLTNNHRA